MNNHTVCNDNMGDDACVCAMGYAEDSPPEKSCNLVINYKENPNFQVVTVKFKLDETTSIHDVFPETRFKEEIGSSLKEDEDDILILRQGCTEDDQQFIVQFVVKDKEAENAEIPYEPDDFVDPEKIVNKMKVIGFLTQIADFDVDEIVATDELIAIEGYADNSVLIIQAIVVGVVVVICCILGIWVYSRKKNDPEYSDNLQNV
uniref:Uncharacterized protein n=1 Tax=Panagrolaimus sp. ES5 TaxID=591445 RepID=A0AC34G071_9BILA